jgi:type I restriction enzyme, S subunit
MSEWKEHKLAEICSLITDGKHGDCANEENSGYYFISAKDVKDGKINYENARQIKKEDFEETDRRTNFSAGDLVITNSGTIGRMAIARDIPETRRTTFQKSVAILKPNKDFVSSEFLYYKLLSSYRPLVDLAGGTTQQNLLLGDLRDFETIIPGKDKQRAIASILSSLDDKIDLLHRQNKTLEAIAETLFRQWFVVEADESREEKSLDEIAIYLNGLPCQKYPPKNEADKLPVIKIKEMNNGFSENSDWVSSEVPEKYIINTGDILFSWSGSLEIKIWADGKGVLNQHLFKVYSEIYPKWLYYFATKSYLAEFRIIAESKSTTMGHIQREHLSSAEIFIPQEERLLNQYDLELGPLTNKIIINHNQINTLTKLREILLPKMMSGEVRAK